MAIEASKITEKDKLIATFYSIRAGLSVIAEETDKIRQGERKLELLVQRNTDHNVEVEAEFIAESKHYDRDIAKIKNPSCENHGESYLIEQRLSKYHRDLEAVDTHKAPFSSAVRAGVGTLVGIMILIAIVAGIANSGDNFNDSLGAICAILGFSCYVAPFVAGSKWRKYKTEIERQEMRAHIEKKIREEQKNLEKAKEKEQSELKVLTKELKALKTQMESKKDAYIGDIESYKRQLTDEIIPACTHTSRAVKSAMLKTSKGVVTEADWANIDLLIFYLETGRADSLKEALQLVDKQRQADQITYAICEANRHICDTLKRNIGRLGSIMQRGFTQLARQIQYNHNEAMNTMISTVSGLEDSIVAGNREMNERLGKMNASIKAAGEKAADAERLNVALLKKANDSSDQLVAILKENQKYWRA